MLNIVIPSEPQLKDFGIFENELSQIESFVVKPIKYGKKRKDKLYNYSIIVFFIVLYLSLVLLLYNRHGWYMGSSIFISSFKMLIMLTFTFIIPIIGVSITKIILEYIIPNRLVHDTNDKYDDNSLAIQKKKEKLSEYKKLHDIWKKEMETLNRKYPDSIIFFPIGLKPATFSYLKHEEKYIIFYVKQYFAERFIGYVNQADRKAEKEYEEEQQRHHKNWWTGLTDAGFEIEVGKWYKEKGYNVSVTQKSGDGGVDIILEKNKEITYVQCKQWKDPVPVSVVRELYGVMSLNQVKNGSIVCLKGGTAGAYDFATRSGIRIVTLADLIKDLGIHSKYEKRQRYLSYLGPLITYGEYKIHKSGWENYTDVQDILKKTKKHFNTQYNTDNVYGLYKCHGFYLTIEASENDIRKLPEIDYIIELNNGNVIYEKPTPMVESNKKSYRTYSKRKKNRGWYGRY